MGLYSSLRGRAASADVEKVTEQVEPFLLEGETIESAYKIFRDMIIFTDRRMVLVDVQGFTGKKKKFEHTENLNFDIVDVNHFLKTHYPKDINMILKPFINTVEIKPNPVYSEYLVYKDFNYHRIQRN